MFLLIVAFVSFVKFWACCCFDFGMRILMLSGDIELNPGPATHYLKKSCRVFYSNIRGLRNNLRDLQAHDSSFDLLFLSETLVSDNKHSVEFLIPGFSEPHLLYRCNIPNAQGMAVYIRSGMPIYCQDKLECICHEILCFKIYSTASLITFMSLLAIAIHPVMILYMTAFWDQCQLFSLLIPKPPLSFVETLMCTKRIVLYLAPLIVMVAQLMNFVSLLAVIN